MNENKVTYSNIFKTTFLFGFVQVFKAIISIVKNKLVALLIGAEGMGLIGIYNSTIMLIQTGAGLGINQSAVRDISESYATNDKTKVHRIIYITNKLVLFTGLIGCLVTLILSKNLSNWTLGDTTHTVAYIILSIVICLNIINEGKIAILKGTRKLKHLAISSLIGSSIGLITAVPLYYFFGKEGIVPEFLVASILYLLVSDYYTQKIYKKNIKDNISIKDICKEGRPMVFMGCALMIVTFLQTVTTFIINSYIRSKGGLDDVGFFNAGNYILTGYFGMVTTALMTDYYPRIAAINNDNNKLQDELNKQSLVSIIICCPLIVIFIALMSFFIKFLYNSEFLVAVDFLKYGIFWTVITIVSNQIDMILIAKYNTRLFILISIIFRIIQVALCLILYNGCGLLGLGISYAVLGVIHMMVMSFVVAKQYNITLNKNVISNFIFMILLAISSTIINEFNHSNLVQLFIIFISVIYTLLSLNKYLEINMIKLIASKFNKF